MKRRDFVLAAASVGSGFLVQTAARSAAPCPPTARVKGGWSPSDNCASPIVKEYATNFVGNENPISEGGVWKNHGAHWAKVQKSGGKAYGTQTGFGGYDDANAHLSGFPPDQVAKATVFFEKQQVAVEHGRGPHEVEILLRWDTAADSTRGYECNFDLSGSPGLGRWNGPFGDFTVLTGADRTGIKTGDVIKASIVGNVITMYLNNVQVLRGIDSTWTNGNPGMGFFIRHAVSSSAYGFTSFSARAVDGTFDPATW